MSRLVDLSTSYNLEIPFPSLRPAGVLPQQDIVSANQLENPDQLFAGQELILPGIDWVDGVLTPQQMPYGETLLSLSRQYRVDTPLLARLSRLTSPSQLFVSYPITMPTQRGEDTSNVRNVVSPGVSLLEMAAATGSNPWTMRAENRLSGTWDAISGDVLLIPGTAINPAQGHCLRPSRGWSFQHRAWCKDIQ